MKGRLLSSAAFAPLLLFAVLPASGQVTCPNQRLITVSGTAEIRVAPDQAILTVGVETRDKDLMVAKTQNDARIKKAIAAIRDAGVDSKDVQTSALSMGPTYSEERAPQLLGYEVSQQITVTLKDLSKYEGLMTKLLQAGVNRIEAIHFAITQERKYKDEARATAIRAAREEAVAMATELGQSVGKPWTIEEQASEFVFSSNAGAQNSQLRYAADEAALASGQVTVRATIQVSFELQ